MPFKSLIGVNATCIVGLANMLVATPGIIIMEDVSGTSPM